MTVDATAIRDKLLSLIPPDSPAAALVDSLRGDMDPRELEVISVAIVRTLAKLSRSAPVRTDLHERAE